MKKFSGISFKILAFAFTLFLLVPLFFKFLEAQGSDELYRDYLSFAPTFKSEYSKFLLARDKYLSFKTIEAEQSLISFSQTMMIARSELIKKYLSFLKARFAKDTGVIDYQENYLYLQFDNQLTSYSGNSSRIMSTNSLADLSALEKTFSSEFEQTKKVSFKSLALINRKNLNIQLENFKKLFAELKQKINEVSQESEGDLTVILRREELIEKDLAVIEDSLAGEIKNKINQIDTLGEKQNPLPEIARLMEEIKKKLSSLTGECNEILYSLKKL